MEGVVTPLQTYGWGNVQYAPVDYPIQWLGRVRIISIRFIDPVVEGDIRNRLNKDAGDYVLDLRARLIAAYVVAVDKTPLNLSAEDALAWSMDLPEPVAVWISVCYERLHLRRLTIMQQMREMKDFRPRTVGEWRRMRDTHAYVGKQMTIEEVAFIEFHQHHDERDRIIADTGLLRAQANIFLLATRAHGNSLKGLLSFIEGDKTNTPDAATRERLFEMNDKYFGKKHTASDEIVDRWKRRWHPNPPER